MSAGETRVQTLPGCASLEEAVRRLGEALEAPEARRGPTIAEAAYLRIEQPLSAADPLPWLRALAPLFRVYWRDRDGTFELAGAGIAEEAEGEDFGVVDALVERVATGAFATSARVIASARFDLLRAPTSDWSAFKRVFAHLPLLELRRSAHEGLLAVNLKVGPGRTTGWYDAQRRTAVRALERARHTSVHARSATIVDLHCEAGPNQWARHVDGLLQQIRSGTLRKAVLARRKVFCAPESVDAIELLARLAHVEPHTDLFFSQPTPQVAFLGASPERLYHRRGRLLETEILAGTRRRGASPPEDERLARELLGSEKDGLEHELVRHFVVDRLTPLCDALGQARPPALRTLPHVHHLHTPLDGRLRDGVGDAAILAALHPTPAVCGLPVAEAMEVIREAEDFDRGLYSGPFGCFGRDETECTVAIRSALVKGREVQLFAGAGIVEGSEADAEWAETIDKMKAFERILGADDVG
jgi:menaquinone-specific isochorismate synthase